MSKPDPLPVRTDWFAIEDADDNGVRRVRETHIHEYGGGSMWLVEGSEKALLADSDVIDLGDRPAFRGSMTRLLALPATVVYPGHFGRGDLGAMRHAIEGYLTGNSACHGENTYAT